MEQIKRFVIVLAFLPRDTTGRLPFTLHSRMTGYGRAGPSVGRDL